ncbi:MAG: TonB-dependent receptor plug domain-containing protein [Bacteroidales bacterium]
MKNFLTATFLFTMSIYSYAQNGTIRAKFIDKDKHLPINALPVWINTSKYITNEKGEITAVLRYGNYVLVVSTDEYENYSQKIELNSDEYDAGNIELSVKTVNQSDLLFIDEQLSVSDDINDKSNQNINGLLHSGSDPFTNSASYNLSAGNFRIRGYDPSYFSVFINGLPMNDIENGRANYSEWGGLNNVTRNKVFSHGIDATNYSFGNIGGSTNILVNAGNIRKQNNFSYAYSNRSYTHRIMYTYATGFNDKGWAYAISLSKRYAEKGYVEGTWYDAYSYFASVEKKWNDKHNTSVTFFGSPYKRAMQSPATQECYDLIGSNYYNPNWGYQDGIKRNAKVRNVHQPLGLIYDKYQFNDQLSLTTTIGYQFGRYGTTALNWYNANDPRPDYYRYLPSYQALDPTQTNPYPYLFTTQYWTSSPSVYQINWNNLYQINYLAKANGESARYIVEEQRKDNNQALYNTYLTYDLNDNTTIYGGLNGTLGKTHYFKTVNDLLGANYWLDVDQFAERDFPTNNIILENDLNNPGKKVKEGDIFGYNYNIHYNNHNAWFLFSQKLNKIDFYIQAQGSNTSFWRYGYMKNGRYPDNSYGKSKVNSFIHYAAKSGVTYKITGRHFLIANVAYLTNPPLAENAFINARTSDRIGKNLSKESILSGDVSYFYRGVNTSFKITAYQTYFNNQTDVRSYYDDSYQTFVNIQLQGIDKVHQGIELGTEIKINSEFTLTGAYNFGNYVYTSNPQATLSYDNGSKPDTIETIYQKYFYIPGFQNAGSIGLKYRNAKYWFVSINFNTFDKNYLEFAPSRRTTNAIANLGPGDPLIKKITEQQKLKGGYTLDFSLGKSWKIKDYYIGINANINNLLDKKDLIAGGYEQMRYDNVTHNINKFPPKYLYAYGRTYFIMLTFRF